MTMGYLKLAGALIIMAVSAFSVHAEPVAIVEDIRPQRENLQIMDFVDVGMKIELTANELMVLGYLNSCIQETIRGGAVTIGEEKSTLIGGQVERRLLTCEGTTKTSTTKSKKGDLAAVVFRNKTFSKIPKAERNVYGLSPLIYLSQKADYVYLSRMDGKDKSYKVGVKNYIVDLAQEGIILRRNVTYRVKAGKRAITFMVSAKAKRKVSVLERLLRF